jgi:hypothetical protein
MTAPVLCGYGLNRVVPRTMECIALALSHQLSATYHVSVKPLSASERDGFPFKGDDLTLWNAMPRIALAPLFLPSFEADPSLLPSRH